MGGSCPWAHQTRGAKEHNKNINIFDEPYVENSWPTGSVLKKGKVVHTRLPSMRYIILYYSFV